MIEDWIDTLTAGWAVSDGSLNGRVRSVHQLSPDFPESLDLAELALHPVALTYLPMLDPIYSQGSKVAIWTGETEFHLAPDITASRARALIAWYTRIWNAAAAMPNLATNTVFWIPDEEDAISKPLALRYGEEALHWGMVVKWKVKDHNLSTITVGGSS